MLQDGVHQTAGEIAEAEKVTCSFINPLLRLTLLAPDIVEAILNGWQPKGLQLEELTRTLPSDCEQQRSLHRCRQFVHGRRLISSIRRPASGRGRCDMDSLLPNPLEARCLCIHAIHIAVNSLR